MINQHLSLFVFVLTSLCAASSHGVELVLSESWAAHSQAAPIVKELDDGRIEINANGTRTCCGGQQFVYSGIKPGQAYRIETSVSHHEIEHPGDSLQAVAYWARWDAWRAKSGQVAFDFLAPTRKSSTETHFASVVTAPEGATFLTVRYIFRWSKNGQSTWKSPQIEACNAPESRPVNLCVVCATRQVGKRIKVQPLASDLGLSKEIESSVNLWGSLVLKACERKPQLIVTPETVIGGRDPLSGGAITVPGPATLPFEKIAREHHVYLMLGLWEQDQGAFYNSAVLIDPTGKVAGIYRKVHLATSEGWSGVSAGDAFPVFDTEIGRVGAMICMDSMAAESARLLALGRAQFVCLPIKGDARADRTTIGPPIFNEDRWKTIMRTRALDNQVFMVIARNGGQGSCIIDPRGDIVAWNEGDQDIIDATVLPQQYRSWDGADFTEVTHRLRRPHLYGAYTDESPPEMLSAVADEIATRPVSKQIKPTHADVHYGDHERQVLDIYAAASDQPTPLAIFIHGGGFTRGDKKGMNADVRDQLLKAGISVAAINYRYADQTPLPAAHLDAARALQYLRSRAREWNIDKTRVAVFGGSAGAQLALYLGLHDDLALPRSDDPIARESTRVTCVASSSGQSTIDPEWMMRWIPGYTKPDRDVCKLFGVNGREALVKSLSDVTALSLITTDDPPVMMTYGSAPDDPPPSDPKKLIGWQVHHVIFGVKLKERTDQLGVESYLNHPRHKSKYSSLVDFMIDKLGQE